MELEQHVAAIAAEGRRFAAAVEAGDLDQRVPTCPEWTVRDLAHHLGLVHLWAAGHVAHPHAEPDRTIVLDDVAEWFPHLAREPADGELADWYRAVNERLVDALRSPAPAEDVWSFLDAPTPVHFWARRQAHELGVHRFDAEHARGTTTPFDPEFAADGTDEMLRGFAARPGRITAPTDRHVHVVATDTGDEWSPTITEAGLVARRGPAGVDPDLTVRGPANDLYLLFWNRPPGDGLTLEGDTSIMAQWRDDAAIRWG